MDATSTTAFTNALMENAKIKEKLQSGIYKILSKKSRSKVWDVFGQILSNEGVEVENKVCCKECFAVLTYDARTTSNLLRHKCYVNSKQINNNVKADVNSDIKTDAEKLLTQWCIDNCRPFQFIEDSGLKIFFNFLISVGAKYGPNVDVEKLLPHPTTVSRNISSIYDATLKNVNFEIAEYCKYGYGLTSDIWTDNYLRQSYISLTIHYVVNGQLISRFLGITSMERNTNDAIRLNIEKLLRTFNCGLNDGIMVTNRGSNMKAAFNQFPHLYCINHLLNNVIEKSIKHVEEVEEICQLSSKVVKYFKKSGQSCKLNSTLQSFFPTRWNTWYYVLESIETNWIEIGNLLQSKNELQKIEKLNIRCIKDLVTILRPFEQASKILESDQYATLHLVYAYVNGLRDNCMPKIDDMDIIKKFKETLCQHLQSTVFVNLTTTHKIAHFLFPPLNKLLQFQEVEKEYIKMECAEQLKKYLVNDGEVNDEKPNVCYNTIVSSYFKNFVMPATVLNSKDKITAELITYQNLNVPFEENFDITKWWDLHQKEFPFLYKLSCKILSTPASSASSERVFSSARLLMSEENTNIVLNSDTLNQIMFLNKNSKLSITNDKSQLA